MAKARTSGRRTTHAASSAAASSPWWLTGRDEECAHCGAGYAYEAEIRCAACDGAMCWFCAVWVEQRGHCRECVPGERG